MKRRTVMSYSIFIAFVMLIIFSPIAIIGFIATRKEKKRQEKEKS